MWVFESKITDVAGSMGDRAATAMASDGEVYMSLVDMMKAVSFLEFKMTVSM